MKIYLDYQIIDHIHKNEIPDFFQKMEKLKKQGVLFPYSPAHCEEIAIAVIQHNEDKKYQCLETVNQISGKKVLLPYPRSNLSLIEFSGVYLFEEDSHQCYARVISDYNRNKIAEKISKDQLEDAQGSAKRVSPILQNNSTAKQLLTSTTLLEICQTSVDMLKTDPHAPKILRDIFHNSTIDMRLYPKKIRFGKLFESIKKMYPLFELTMELSFKEVESLGYYPEPTESYRSRLHDGAHCNYLVTFDKKFRKKCAVIFEALGAPCKVVAKKDFLELKV